MKYTGFGKMGMPLIVITGWVLMWFLICSGHATALFLTIIAGLILTCLFDRKHA